MRRLTILFALCAAAILALAPAALAQQEADLDCSQLGAPGASPEEAQAEAQATFDADPVDPNGLDADGDGTACEFEASPNGEVAFEDGTGFVTDAAAPQNKDLSCADFTSQAEVQAALDADPSDPNGLDADGDGVACNELFSAPPTQAAEPTAQYRAPESPSVEVAPVTPPPGADGPVFQPAEPDVAATPHQTPGTGVEVAPVSPPPGADSPVFQPKESDVAETSAPSSPSPASDSASLSPSSSSSSSSSPSSSSLSSPSPSSPSPVSPAPRPSSSLKQLPATGGALLVGALAGGVLLLGFGALATAARKSRS